MLYLLWIPIFLLWALMLAPMFQAYRKWEGGLWFRPKNSWFAPWVKSDLTVVFDNVPGLKEHMEIKYFHEDWRQNADSNSRIKADLKIVK